MSAHDRSHRLPQRALVTGATGFVGSHLVRRLVTAGVEVHALWRQESSPSRLHDVQDRVQVHRGSLDDLAFVAQTIRAISPDAIFHLASAGMVAGQSPDARTLLATNLGGTMNLLEACEAIACPTIVLTGDSFEYTPSHGRLSEASECLPGNLHGSTTLLATRHACTIARANRWPIVTLRLFSVYGPGDNPRRLIPRLIQEALAGRPLPLARPDIVRDWVFVDDVVDLYLEAAQRAPALAGEIFNVGSGIATTLGETVDTLLALTRSTSAPGWGAFDAPGHDAYPWVADMQRTFGVFDWRPAVSFHEGLRATIAASEALIPERPVV